jgi:hypothetical protein
MNASIEEIRLSVVIPTYNRARVVPRAIESALAQRFPPFEVILVDDGSTDDTLTAVHPFLERITLVRQPNRGAAIARNRGVDISSGNWIAFLDSDDYWPVDYLQRMTEAIQSTNGKASFYFSDTTRPQDEGNKSQWENAGFGISSNVEYIDDASEWVMRRPHPMMVQSTVISKTAFTESGGFWDKLRIREDTHLFLKLGLGNHACAVAGTGARMTADGKNEVRLSSILTESTGEAHYMQVLMFGEILRRTEQLTPPIKKEIRRRLADAHRQLARYSWRTRRPFRAFRHASQSVVIHPSRFLKIMVRTVKGPQLAR